MTLEEILTNRNHLSEDILSDVKESAATYGVAILRADVKDLVFPGNLQEIMNKVLAAERLSQAQLVEARTKAETERIAQAAKLQAQREQAETLASLQRLTAETDAEATLVRTEADVAALRARENAAQAYTNHPALLRLRELETLQDLAKQANARIYIDFDRRTAPAAVAE
jgi:regulator of protease activity HflC (stomatin/prohibitin superfamily)